MYFSCSSLLGLLDSFPKQRFITEQHLLVPVSIAIILLAIRGSYYAFETYGSRGHKGYSFMYGISWIIYSRILIDCPDDFRRWIR